MCQEGSLGAPKVEGFTYEEEGLFMSQNHNMRIGLLAWEEVGEGV